MWQSDLFGKTIRKFSNGLFLNIAASRWTKKVLSWFSTFWSQCQSRRSHLFFHTSFDRVPCQLCKTWMLWPDFGSLLFTSAFLTHSCRGVHDLTAVDWVLNASRQVQCVWESREPWETEFPMTHWEYMTIAQHKALLLPLSHSHHLCSVGGTKVGAGSGKEEEPFRAWKNPRESHPPGTDT